MRDNFTIYLMSVFFISNASMASDLTRDEVKTALKHPANKSLLDALPSLDPDVESRLPEIAKMLELESRLKKSPAQALSSKSMLARDLSRADVKEALKHPSNRDLLALLPTLGLDAESNVPLIAEMLSPESLVKQSAPKPQVSVSSASSSSTQPARSMLSVRDPAESDVVAPVFPGFKGRINTVEKAKDKKNFKDSDTTDELMIKLLKRRLESEEK